MRVLIERTYRFNQHNKVVCTNQSLVSSYVQTGAHLAPEVTAKRMPSKDHLTSNAARSIRRITRAGIHLEEAES